MLQPPLCQQGLWQMKWWRGAKMFLNLNFLIEMRCHVDQLLTVYYEHPSAHKYVPYLPFPITGHTHYLLNQFAQLSPINHSKCKRIMVHGFVCRMCFRFISFHYASALRLLSDVVHLLFVHPQCLIGILVSSNRTTKNYQKLFVQIFKHIWTSKPPEQKALKSIKDFRENVIQ